eukprot:11187673-Alexandrium_andersonii.AAC.1
MVRCLSGGDPERALNCICGGELASLRGVSAVSKQPVTAYPEMLRLLQLPCTRRPAPNVFRQTHNRRCNRLQQFAAVCN